MRRHGLHGNSGGNASRGYLVIGIVVAVCFGLFLLWPSDGSWTVGGGTTRGSSDRIIAALLSDNERLQEALEKAAIASSVTGGVPQVDTACISEVASLRAEVQRLQRQLETATRADCPVAAPSRAVAVQPASGAPAEVPSCAHQKLEFLRWQTGPDGKELKCPFTPENYDNWEKLPPFCDYISIECLGPGNLRAAHVFGFGGPSLMIGYADVMMWEFVFARHQRQQDMVELGTMSGGTSMYWGMTANVRGGEFHTFDLNDNRASAPKRGWLPNMHFHKEDILSGVNCDDPSTHNPVVVEVINTGKPQIALFDNGNKKKETDCYARYLVKGSVLLLHDWEHLDLPKPHWEMTYSYVSKTLESLGFVKAYFDFAEHIGSSTRAFIRV